MAFSETIGARISRLRREKNLTQDELSERLGVSAQAVSKWENDQSCPDISLLPELAGILGITVDELLTGKSSDAPPVEVVPAEKRKKPEELMLRITVDSSDGDKVRVNLPFILIKAALDMGLDFSDGDMGINMNGMNEKLGNIDFGMIVKLVENGMLGELVTVESGDGDTVSIRVE